MSRFGEVWCDHESKIIERWTEVVKSDDLVLIPGDFSWATTTKQIRRHVEIVDNLPGQVVISPGNHCKFWKKTPRLQYESVRFLADDHVDLAPGWMLAATMGWDSPESPWWKDEMKEKFELSLENLSSTLKAVPEGKKILLMIHYPPRWKDDETPTAIESIIKDFEVELVVYGHIHGVDLPLAHNGDKQIGSRKLRYENGSVDRIEMRPIQVLSF